MKRQLLLLSSLLLAATFSTPALANNEDAGSTIRLTGRPYIERGMTRETVLEMFGAPSGRLSAEVWVYFDFQAVNPVASGAQSSSAAAKQDALVIAFKGDRVSAIRACDSKPVHAFIAQQEKSKTPASIVAAK
jgi:outer membrane protein assembly factor BamE (lipoprotein component of BamABCDE complex)